MKYYKSYIIDIMLILAWSAVGAINLISGEPITPFRYGVTLFTLITVLACNAFAKYIMSKNDTKNNKKKGDSSNGK